VPLRSCCQCMMVVNSLISPRWILISLMASNHIRVLVSSGHRLSHAIRQCERHSNMPAPTNPAPFRLDSLQHQRQELIIVQGHLPLLPCIPLLKPLCELLDKHKTPHESIKRYDPNESVRVVNTFDSYTHAESTTE
jgi:hypothetical protein